MRAPHAYRGFTLVELLAAITILAILAAVALPRVTAATSFSERGFADEVAAHLRRARLVALTTGCDVQFSINASGYLAQQRGMGANNHCAPAGAWSTTVFSAPKPAKASLAVNRQVTFNRDGTASTAITINIGARQVMVETSGLVSGS